MVSRDTAVQFVAVVVAITLGALAGQLGSGTTGASLLLGAASYVVVFAGAHVYLALRGEGDAVPVAARWRFVGLVLVAATAIVVGVTYRSATIGRMGLSTVLGLLVATLFLGYWLYEAREGYVASRRQ